MAKARMALLLVACGLYACKRDAPLEPLPLNELSTYEEVTVDVRPTTDGSWLLCRRAPTDPFLDHARFLNDDGSLGPRIDFASLPRLVENVQFAEEDIWISELLPIPNGGVVLLGLGIQREQDDRLHLIMYQLDASLRPSGTPLRRFVRSRADLGISNDIDRAYDAKALGCLLGNDAEQVAVIVRSRSEASTERRLFVLPRTAASSFATTGAISFADADHDLQFLLTDPSSPHRVWLGLDTSGVGASSALLIQHIDLSEEFPLVLEQGVAQARNAHVNEAQARAAELILVGHAEPGQAGQLRPFIAALSTANSIDAALTFLNIDEQRSVSAYAVDADVQPAWVGLSVYEQAIVTDELRREDLFADLVVCRVSDDGSLSNEQRPIPAQGLRPMAIRESGNGARVIGILHPFLNLDLVHTFMMSTEP